MFNNMGKIDTESNYPDMSLTKWGDPVLSKADKIFKKAQKLSYSGKKQEAIDSFNNCITVIVKSKSCLFIDQYINILLHIAYCYSDIGKFENAFNIYQEREKILLQQLNWNEVLPSGLNIAVRENFDSTILLAQNYQELAILFYHKQEYNKSKEYFSKSSELFLSKNLLDQSLKNYIEYLSSLARHYNQWDDLEYCHDRIIGMIDPTVNINHYLISKRILILAYVNKKNFKDSIVQLNEIIKIQKDLGHNTIELSKDLDTLELLNNKI